MILYEFDNCYEQQNFYKEESHCKRMDFSTLEGVNGYCDEEAAMQILKVMENQQHTLAFCGNGNYHYMSYLLLQQVKQDISLFVLDHHPDMQPSFFAELLSCGCWIKHAVEQLDHVKEVVVLGVKTELLEELAQTEGFTLVENVKGVYRYENNGKPIVCVAEECFMEETLWSYEQMVQFLQSYISYPVYVSVDKDVLAETDCVTNWDAGSMTLKTMEWLLCALAKNHTIIAMDVCGEWDGQESTIIERPSEIIEKNNRCNKQLLAWWKQNNS